jgi:hypothetical protein
MLVPYSEPSFLAVRGCPKESDEPGGELGTVAILICGEQYSACRGVQQKIIAQLFLKEGDQYAKTCYTRVSVHKSSFDERLFMIKRRGVEKYYAIITQRW